MTNPPFDPFQDAHSWDDVIHDNKSPGLWRDQEHRRIDQMSNPPLLPRIEFPIDQRRAERDYQRNKREAELDALREAQEERERPLREARENVDRVLGEGAATVVEELFRALLDSRSR